MERDIQRIYKTSRVSTYMFTELTRTGFVIESFFALELYFILDRLINNRRVTTDVRTLGRIRNALKANTWLKDIDSTELPERLDLSRLKNMAYPPLPFQFEFLKQYSETVNRFHLKGMLLAGTAGSGKTYTSLALAECLRAERMVVVCPLNAVNRVWEANINSVFKTKQTYWYSSSGKKYAGERFLIVHYEALEHALALVPLLRDKKTLVVLDESHNLNEMKTLRTQRFIDLCLALGHQDTILASGTPVKAVAVETIPLFNVIDSYFNDAVLARFKKMYQGEANAATEILSHRLNIVSFKIEKAELNLDKPIFKEIKVKIPDGDVFTLKAIAKDMAEFVKAQQAKYAASAPEDRKFFYHCIALAEEELLNPYQHRRELIQAQERHARYLNDLAAIIKANGSRNLSALTAEMAYCNKYEKDSILPNLPKELHDRFKETKTLVKYVKLKIQGECLGRVLGRKRIDVHLAMLPYVDFDSIFNSTTKKTVVFTTYTEVVEQCQTLLKHSGHHPVCVYGKATGDLQSALNAFEHKEEINPLIATYASLSTAVPLIMADTMLMINTPFRNYVFEQAISRIHRLGADTQTCIYTLALDTDGEPNISSRTIDILKWSQEQVERILQTESPFKIEETEEGSVVSELLPSIVLEELAIEQSVPQHKQRIHPHITLKEW